MPNTKTWTVNSANSRHDDLDGETVPLDDVFSNGMAYPGDPAGGPENTVNCQCTLDVNFTSFEDVTNGTNAEYESRRDLMLQKAGPLWDEHNHGNMLKATDYLRQVSGDLSEIPNVPLNPFDADRALGEIKVLDDLFAKAGHEFNAPEVLYRGVDDVGGWFDPQVGATFTDEGYMFATMSPTGVDLFVGDAGWKIECLVQRGTQALAYTRHKAMLFNRGQSWRVIDVDRARRVVRMVAESA